MEKENLKEFIEQLDLIVTIQNADFEILMQNRKSKEYFGEVVGKKCYEVFHNTPTPPKFCRIYAALKGDSGWEEFYEPSLKKWFMTKASKVEVDGETFSCISLRI